MPEFDRAELKRLADEMLRCGDQESKADANDDLNAYLINHRHAIIAALTRAQSEYEKRVAFTSRLQYGDDTREGGTAAELSDMVEAIESAFQDQRDFWEAPVICEPCGETLAGTVCEHCHGSGADNTACAVHLAHVECEWCAGVGKVHLGCVEKSYAELVAERDAALARTQEMDEAIVRVRTLVADARSPERVRAGMTYVPTSALDAALGCATTTGDGE